MTDRYDGDDVRNPTIMRARERIRSVHWSRHGKNFKFADYCNKHVTANNNLNRYGTNIDGKGQLNAFLLDIKANATVNPHFKAAILMNPACKGNIGRAVIKFKDTVKKMGVVMSGGNTRSI